jgi:hypothetical protein
MTSPLRAPSGPTSPYGAAGCEATLGTPHSGIPEGRASQPRLRKADGQGGDRLGMR